MKLRLGVKTLEENNLYQLDRVGIRVVREPMGPLVSDVPLNTPEAVAKLLHDEIFADLDRECFAVINLKSDLKFAGLYPISLNICSIGTLNESLVHPREVLKSSILQNASAVLLVHNHPSGKLEPSREDVVVTDRLMQLYNLMGIEVLDHIILAPQEEFYSFREKGVLPIGRLECVNDVSRIDFAGQKVAEPGWEPTVESGSIMEKLQYARAASEIKAESKEKAGTKIQIKNKNHNKEL